MKIKIEIQRSKEWVEAQRLARGENIPDQITVEVEVADLSEAVRKIMLASGGGQYDERWSGRFGQDYQFYRFAGYGYQRPVVDSYAPTAAEIDAAILDSANALNARRLEHEERQRQRAEDERRQREEKQRQEAELARARELLKGELEQGQEYLRQRDILADFLSSVPNDALRGTLKSLAHSPEAVDALRKRIEDASPFTVFVND